MSVDFYPATSNGRPLFRCERSGMATFCDCAADTCVTRFMNLANINAADLLRWIGLPCDAYGTAPAREVAALCRRRLWPEARNEDPARPSDEYRGAGGCTVFMVERRPGYLREKTEALLALAEAAGDEFIAWA